MLNIRIIDSVNLINEYRKLAGESTDTEHCAVAIGRCILAVESCYEILDYCSVNDLGVQSTANSVTIPRRISYSLIQICREMGKVPIILHTHPPDTASDDYVSFSDADRKFMNRFVSVAMKSGYDHECLFIVTDGNTVMVCEKSKMKEQYTLL